MMNLLKNKWLWIGIILFLVLTLVKMFTNGLRSYYYNVSDNPHEARELGTLITDYDSVGVSEGFTDSVDHFGIDARCFDNVSVWAEYMWRNDPKYVFFHPKVITEHKEIVLKQEHYDICKEAEFIVQLSVPIEEGDIHSFSMGNKYLRSVKFESPPDTIPVSFYYYINYSESDTKKIGTMYYKSKK